MYAEERRRQIASLTAIEGRVNVTELAARFDVTAETIRRDLAVLDNEGTVHRVHGGAVASQNFQTAELTVDARAKSASSAKSAIARAALDFLPAAQGGMFLDAGTTLAPLAELIADHPNARQWSIVTNCLPIAMSLASAGLDGTAAGWQRSSDYSSRCGRYGTTHFGAHACRRRVHWHQRPYLGPRSFYRRFAGSCGKTRHDY